MMKKVLFNALIACLYTPLVYASGVTIEALPEKPNVIDLTRLNGVPQFIQKSVLTDLQTVIAEERTGTPLFQKWHKVHGFTLEEGKKYLKGEMESAFASDKELLKLLPLIFSDRHFVVPTPVSHVDILEASDEMQYALYCNDPLTSTSIGNCLTSVNFDALERERNRIDPRLFMMGSQKIRNFYFRQLNRKEEHSSDPAYEQFKDQLFGHFDFPQSLEERRQFYLTHELSFLTQVMIGNIFNTVNGIADYTTVDSNVVIFGNTPYYVGRGLRHRGELDPLKKRNIIEFPFSGTPNSIRAQSFGFENEDIVTPERLEHLRKRLRSHGLMNGQELLQHKTYFVDVIGGGGGVAYTLATILQELKTQGLPQMPHFEIISLNLFDKTYVKHQRITSADGKNGDKIQLSFPSKTACHFKIDCKIIHLPGHEILDIMPDETPVLRVFPRYNAAYWSEEYDYLLAQDYPSHIKIMFEHFDTNIRHLMMQSLLPSLEMQADVEMADVEKS